jgi:hypothetical protein
MLRKKDVKEAAIAANKEKAVSSLGRVIFYQNADVTLHKLNHVLVCRL